MTPQTIAFEPASIISSSAGLGYPGQRPYSFPPRTRPPSSRPVAPVWPFADHRLQASPFTVPLATCVAELSIVVGEPPEVAASVVGEQVELAVGTLAMAGEAALEFP